MSIYNNSIYDLNIDIANKLDEVLLNSFYATRNNILYDILDEGIGLPYYKNESFDFTYVTGNEKLSYNYIDEFNNKHIHYNNYIGNPEEPEGITIFDSILRYMNFNNGNGKWAQAVIDIGNWYSSNIHDYSQQKTSECDILDNKKVRHDCSGFTTACLWKMGVLLNVSNPPASTEYTSDIGSVADALKTAGFTPLKFTSFEDCLPFDIISLNGHVEIFYSKDKGKYKSYAWGNVHDIEHGGLPCSTAKNKYTHIWRPSASLAIMNGEAGILDITGTGAQAVARECYNALSAKGFTRNQIIGILCNIYQESRFNPRALNSIGASGLCQWLGVRKTKFVEKYGKQIINATPTEQINYAIWEIDQSSKYYHAAELRAAQTVAEACKIWLVYFERPGNYEKELTHRLSFQSTIEKFLS